MLAPWRCSCAACSRGKATVRASAGYRSTLTDTGTDTRVLLLWTDPVHSFLWTFLLEHGRLSKRILALSKRLLVFRLPLWHSGDTTLFHAAGRQRHSRVVPASGVTAGLLQAGEAKLCTLQCNS